MNDEQRLAEIRARHDQQLAAAQRRRWSADPESEYPPSRWSHVPLLQLIGQHNSVQRQGPDRYTSGHEPRHSSKSGTCLIIWPREGRYWCSSCHESGDAVTWVAALQGISRPDAVAWLAARYGAPAQEP